MSTLRPPPAHPFARRKPPHRIILARGETVRSYTVRPWLIGVVAGVALIFGALYIVATGYLIFRDDLLAASLARQTRMQQAYEDRIAALRSDIDRLTSRQLLNQQAVEMEVERLLGRQAALDARQDVIAGLSQAVRRAGLAPADIVPGPDEGTTPQRASDPLRTSDAGAAGLSTIADVTAAPVIEMRAVEASLDDLARQQVAYVDAVAAGVSRRVDGIAGVLKRLGHRVPAGTLAAQAGIGGPFVAVDPQTDPETFRTRVEIVSNEIDRLGAVRRMAGQLPLSKPVPNGAITSRYGSRIDPFLGQPAMHTGIDFRAATGDPAKATADGTVVIAEYSGGYGNLVEIDHGNGVTTRFGHLSRIDVTSGQVVNKGTVVGRAGSTGRSTGPHLHYEIRIDGEPIDPMRYIKAGAELAPLL